MNEFRVRDILRSKGFVVGLILKSSRAKFKLEITELELLLLIALMEYAAVRNITQSSLLELYPSYKLSFWKARNKLLSKGIIRVDKGKCQLTNNGILTTIEISSHIKTLMAMYGT